MKLTHSQKGLTLLEVLIALSIFALIGVASFRVLSAVIESQRTAEQHSTMMNQFNTVMNILDNDFQQLAERPVRTTADAPSIYSPPLSLNEDDYPLIVTRAGWRNPLKLSRSTFQRVAYSIGPHPKSTDKNSQFFEDDVVYLLRHHWPHLDVDKEQTPLTRPLLANVNGFSVQVLDDNFIKHTKWPPELSPSDPVPELIAIELSFDHEELGQVIKRYKVN